MKVARRRTRDEYAVPFTILKSLTRLRAVVLQHEVMLYVIVISVSVSCQNFPETEKLSTDAEVAWELFSKLYKSGEISSCLIFTMQLMLFLDIPS